MNNQLSRRVNLVKQEFARGPARLQEIARQELVRSEDLRRISGAIDFRNQSLTQHTPRGYITDRYPTGYKAS